MRANLAPLTDGAIGSAPVAARYRGARDVHAEAPHLFVAHYNDHSFRGVRSHGLAPLSLSDKRQTDSA